mmetsp:Transcript_37574/g.61101  ORF Transcript_37574/g.61101 Transcript_37574/m.61101 type:complete len:94 (-) Transcript_37574:88-369(-)
MPTWQCPFPRLCPEATAADVMPYTARKAPTKKRSCYKFEDCKRAATLTRDIFNVPTTPKAALLQAKAHQPIEWTVKMWERYGRLGAPVFTLVF